jgi:hypothetical protein
MIRGYGTVSAILTLALLTGPAVVFAGNARQQQPAQANGCVGCHAVLEERLAAPVELLGDDVHAERGFSCVNCHGGDDATDVESRAKDPVIGYEGAPVGLGVVETCSRCHSDAVLMRRFAPAQRVDQATEYAASAHGRGLEQGDTNVATCVSCHGAHGVRRVSDARSLVFPLNVADTCAACHADPTVMAGYQAAGGGPLPTTQHADFQRSVHHEALTRGNDLSAPTCNDCHGNHGAAPPGVGDVANVCGTCHASFSERFVDSTHGFLFDRGCTECHGNHAVEPGTDDMLGDEAPANCVICHETGDTGLVAAARMRSSIERFKGAFGQAETLVERLTVAGMEMGDQELELARARNQLTLARTEVHAFDADRVDPIIDEGLGILADVEAAGVEAQAELRFRRLGLGVSLVFILLFVAALGLKVRQLDRVSRGGG